MPLKTDAMEEPAINMTPMIDVVFLLLIFFMVGSEFSEMSHEVTVELPTTSDAQPLTELPDELVVGIQQNGQLTLNQTEVTLQELETRLTAARERYTAQKVRIQGDGRVPYQQVVRVLDVVRNRAGITSVGLAVQIAAEQPPTGNP